jgi:glycine cleavage system regulatory protein
VVSTNDVVQWSFDKITIQQFEDTKAHVQKDSADRKNYLESAFTQVIMDLQIEIQELQSKVLVGDK